MGFLSVMIAARIHARQRAAAIIGDSKPAHLAPISGLVSVTAQEANDDYRVYSGPRGSQPISPLEKDRHLFKEFATLDEAMSWARHINDGGRVALLIEGDDGTRLTKQEISTALRNPDSEPSVE